MRNLGDIPMFLIGIQFLLFITKGTQKCKHCPKFPIFSTLFESKLRLHLFTSKTNQKSVKYSVDKSNLINIEVQNVNKAFVYIENCNPSLINSLVPITGRINRSNPKI